VLSRQVQAVQAGIQHYAFFEDLHQVLTYPVKQKEVV